MVTGQLSILSVSLRTKQTNRWPHGQRPKKSYFSSACEYVKLSFSLRVPKKIIIQQDDAAPCTAYLVVRFFLYGYELMFVVLLQGRRRSGE
jgi:hypothetical protein